MGPAAQRSPPVESCAALLPGVESRLLFTAYSEVSNRMHRTVFGQRCLRRLAWVSILTVGCGSTAPRSVTTVAEFEYESGTPIDFARIRTEYGDLENFSDICQRDRPLKEFIELTNAGRSREVLEISQPWVAKCPVDIDAQFVTAVALSALGRTLEAERHIAWYRGLVDSVLASGDGRSARTAFTVISVEEEYSLLRVMKLRVKSQSLLIDGNIDALAVEGKSGEFDLFFNPAAHFRRIDRIRRRIF